MQCVQMGCGVEMGMIDVPVVLHGVALRNVKTQNWWNAYN